MWWAIIWGRKLSAARFIHIFISRTISVVPVRLQSSNNEYFVPLSTSVECRIRRSEETGLIAVNRGPLPESPALTRARLPKTDPSLLAVPTRPVSAPSERESSRFAPLKQPCAPLVALEARTGPKRWVAAVLERAVSPALPPQPVAPHSAPTPIVALSSTGLVTVAGSAVPPQHTLMAISPRLLAEMLGAHAAPAVRGTLQSRQRDQNRPGCSEATSIAANVLKRIGPGIAMVLQARAGPTVPTSPMATDVARPKTPAISSLTAAFRPDPHPDRDRLLFPITPGLSFSDISVGARSRSFSMLIPVPGSMPLRGRGGAGGGPSPLSFKGVATEHQTSPPEVQFKPLPPSRSASRRGAAAQSSPGSKATAGLTSLALQRRKDLANEKKKGPRVPIGSGGEVPLHMAETGVQEMLPFAASRSLF
jgi:hypothetical protein